MKEKTVRKLEKQAEAWAGISLGCTFPTMVLLICDNYKLAAVGFVVMLLTAWEFLSKKSIAEEISTWH